MITKRKNNAVEIAKSLLGGGDRIFSSLEYSETSNENLNEDINSIKDSITNLESDITNLEDTKDNKPYFTYRNVLRVDDNPLLPNNITYFTYELNLPDNGIYEVKGMIQVDFNTDTATRYLYINELSDKSIGYTLIGGGNPRGCTGMSLEIPIKVCVKNKELMLYGDRPIAGAGTATYRIYLVAYRKLGD